VELLEWIYEAWVKNKQPLWKAHQFGMQRLQSKGGNMSHPYHWGPFMLFGYWE